MKKILLFALLAGCADDPRLPSCKSMGCDGSQAVALYCPEHDEDQPAEGSCFCAAPDGPDGWCVP